jgi:hypothetical protein
LELAGNISQVEGLSGVLCEGCTIVASALGLNPIDSHKVMTRHLVRDLSR